MHCFFLRRPGKRCSAATNKQPYANIITSSGAAFNSITPALCLNKGSAIATDLIGARDEDGERERGWRKRAGVEGCCVKHEQELEMRAVADALAGAGSEERALSASGTTI